jgi:hypothetical protein
MLNRHGRPAHEANRLLHAQWHRAAHDAQRARWRFLASSLSTTGQTLKQQLCDRARKLNFRLCPLCC